MEKPGPKPGLVTEAAPAGCGLACYAAVPAPPPIFCLPRIMDVCFASEWIKIVDNSSHSHILPKFIFRKIKGEMKKNEWSFSLIHLFWQAPTASLTNDQRLIVDPINLILPTVCITGLGAALT